MTICINFDCYRYDNEDDDFDDDCDAVRHNLAINCLITVAPPPVKTFLSVAYHTFSCLFTQKTQKYRYTKHIKVQKCKIQKWEITCTTKSMKKKNTAYLLLLIAKIQK